MHTSQSSFQIDYISSIIVYANIFENQVNFSLLIKEMMSTITKSRWHSRWIGDGAERDRVIHRCCLLVGCLCSVLTEHSLNEDDLFNGFLSVLWLFYDGLWYFCGDGLWCLKSVISLLHS